MYYKFIASYAIALYGEDDNKKAASSSETLREENQDAAPVSCAQWLAFKSREPPPHASARGHQNQNPER
jgi:hypothetical protein